MGPGPTKAPTSVLPAEPRVDPDRPVDPEVVAFEVESNPLKRAVMVLGPGLITGASDDDPSGIATYAQTGARYGYTFLWTTIAMLPMMISIQYICARIGLVTGRGLAGVFRQKTRAEWCELMEHTDVCFAPVLTLTEAPQHPHNIERGTFVERNGVVQPAPAPRFSRTTAEIQRPPSFAGQHTDEALADWGVDAATIAKLRETGAVK